MAKSKRAKKRLVSDRFWLTLDQLCEEFGKSPQYFRDAIIKRVEDGECDDSRQAKRYSLRAILRVWNARPGRGRSAYVNGDEADPLLVGVSSPALERYRMARADAAEMEVLRQRGDLLPREQWEASIEAVVSPIRGVANQACPDCRRRFNEAIERVRAGIGK